MKIVYIINKLSKAGAEKQLFLIVKRLREEHHLLIIVLKGGGNFEREFRALGIPIISADNDSPFYIFKNFCSIKKVLNIIKSEKPDIIHTWLFKSNLIGGVVKLRFPKIKLIVSERNTFFWFKKRHFLLDRFIYHMSDAILVNAFALKKQIQKYYPTMMNKTKVVHNGIDLGIDVKNIPSVKVLQEKKKKGYKIIGYVARFAYQKRHIDIIEAIGILQRKYPNLHFVFIGNGSTLEKCKEKVKEACFQNMVSFITQVDDTLSYMKAFDILLHPSSAEGMPNAIMEAMLLGKPIIAADAGGVRELIENEVNGIIIPPYRPDKIAEAVVSLAYNDKLQKRFLISNRKKIRKFSSDKMAKIVNALYVNTVRS